MTEGKMIRNRQMNMLIMIAIIVGICIPLFFTAVQIGVFAKEPVVEARQEVTDESASVLRVADDVPAESGGVKSRCNSRSGDIFKYAACIKDSSGDNRPA